MVFSTISHLICEDNQLTPTTREILNWIVGALPSSASDSLRPDNLHNANTDKVPLEIALWH